MKVWPEIVTVQLRLVPVPLLVAVKVTVLLPLPLVGDAVSQEVHGLSTVQLQFFPVVTLTLTLPPAAGADHEYVESVAAQLLGATLDDGFPALSTAAISYVASNDPDRSV